MERGGDIVSVKAPVSGRKVSSLTPLHPVLLHQLLSAEPFGPEKCFVFHP